MKRVICWWFGCRPQYEPDRDGFSCSRCGAWDVSYSDLVGDNRHVIVSAYLRGLARPTKQVDVSDEDIPF